MSESPGANSEFEVGSQGRRSDFKSNLRTPGARLIEQADQPRLDILARTEKMETTLLTEFRRWSGNFEAQLKANEALIFGFNERLISAEERLRELERK
jgi:hypothetical protein